MNETKEVEMPVNEALSSIAFALDRLLNGEQIATNPLEADRKNGFLLLLFPYGEHEGRANMVGNGANREDIIRLLERQLEKLENAKG